MNNWACEALTADLGEFHLGPISLSLPAGRATALLGRSGAGKTTLLRALAGHLPCRSGRLLRDGEELTRAPPEARSVGYVPQGLGLFPHRTVEENVRYPLEVAGRPDAAERAAELLDRFRLRPLARRYPTKLSGGEAQRVALARALAREPALLLWDEPWQGLDVEARRELGLLLHALRRDERVPIALVTHDPELAFSVADRFAVLSNGRLAATTDAPSLLDAPPDAFTARFVGFENVLDRRTLDEADASPLSAWLAELAGPGGIAFPARALRRASAGEAGFAGRLVSARPGPSGLTLEIGIGTLALLGREERAPGAPPPELGQELRIAIDRTSLHPLGLLETAPSGAA